MTERKFGGAFGRFSTGKIVDVESDPTQSGKVKVLLDGIHDGLTKDDVGYVTLHHGTDNAATGQQGSGPHQLRVGSTVQISHYEIDQQYAYFIGTQHKVGDTDGNGKLKADSDIPQSAKEKSKSGPDGNSYAQPNSGDNFPNPPKTDGNPTQPDVNMPIWKFGREKGPANRNKPAQKANIEKSIGYLDGKDIPLYTLVDHLLKSGNPGGVLGAAIQPLTGMPGKSPIKEQLYHQTSKNKKMKPGDKPKPPNEKGMGDLNDANKKQGMDDASQIKDDNGDQPYQDMLGGPYDPGNGSDNPGVPVNPDASDDTTPVAGNDNTGPVQDFAYQLMGNGSGTVV
jgi:hypothetical protein